jgi:hypothetical protein
VGSGYARHAAIRINELLGGSRFDKSGTVAKEGSAMRMPSLFHEWLAYERSRSGTWIAMNRLKWATYAKLLGPISLLGVVALAITISQTKPNDRLPYWIALFVTASWFGLTFVFWAPFSVHREVVPYSLMAKAQLRNAGRSLWLTYKRVEFRSSNTRLRTEFALIVGLLEPLSVESMKYQVFYKNRPLVDPVDFRVDREFVGQEVIPNEYIERPVLPDVLDAEMNERELALDLTIRLKDGRNVVFGKVPLHGIENSQSTSYRPHN